MADGLRLPLLDVAHVEEVVAHLGFGDERGIAAVELVDEAHAAVVGVHGALAVVSQCQEAGELEHGRIGMMGVVDGVHILAAGVDFDDGLGFWFW